MIQFNKRAGWDCRAFQFMGAGIRHDPPKTIRGRRSGPKLYTLDFRAIERQKVRCSDIWMNRALPRVF